MNTVVNIVIPQETKAQIGVATSTLNSNTPTLFLLHGYSDNFSTWLRRTCIERYAEERGFAVVMPEVHKSYYTNTQYGIRYFDFVADELPAFVKSFFRLNLDPGTTCIAGLSMGGYGAFKIALKRPQQFVAAASLSGVMDVLDMINIRMHDPHRMAEFEATYGPTHSFDKSEHDLKTILINLVSSGTKIPALYSTCGTEDFLYEQNLKWVQLCEDKNVPLDWLELPGIHDWNFWELTIPTVLDWMLGKIEAAN